MSYFMRYVTTSATEPTLEELSEALATCDEAYRLVAREGAAEVTAALFHGRQRIGTLAIHTIGDELFDDELEGLRDGLDAAVEEDEGLEEAADRVRVLLDGAQSMVVLQVVFGGKEPEDVLALVDPLWQVLFEDHPGMLQADGEGWHDDGGAVLELEQA